MGAVYRLGKLVSKYIILEVIGFAAPRKEAAELLIDTSTEHRVLIVNEFPIFLKLTVPSDILELGTIGFNHHLSRISEFPNLFFPANFKQPHKVKCS